MTIITTGFSPSIRRLTVIRAADPSKIVTNPDWEEVAEWTCDPPTTIDNWGVSVTADIAADDGVTGELRLRVSDGTLSGFVPITPPLQRAVVDWTKVPLDFQRVFLEARWTGGTGGLRVINTGGLLMSAYPGFTPGGGTGGGSDPIIAPTVRATYAPDGANASQSSFTILSTDFSDTLEAGDKVLILGAAKGGAEVASWTWNFPGTQVFVGESPGFQPRIIGHVVEYTGGTGGWTASAGQQFRIAAVALANAGTIAAGAPEFGGTPTDPPGLANDDDSLGLAYTALNFTGGNVTGPPAGHATVLTTQTDIRSRHVHSIDLPTAGTYDPGAAPVGPGVENGSAIALTVAPSGATGTPTIDPPLPPVFNAGTAVTLQLTDDVAAVVDANPAGTHFQLLSGTYTDWEDVRPKTGMYFLGPTTGQAVLDGAGKGYCFRALDWDGTSDNVTIGENIRIENYGNNTAREDFAAIQTYPTDTLANQFTFGNADGWFIFRVELVNNAASGIRLSDNCTVFNCTIRGHSVTGIHGNRAVGGLIYANLLEGNGIDPATGIYSNGANIKVVWHNAAEGRSETLPAAALRTPAALNVVNNNFTATAGGVTGTGRVGFWADLDCQLVNVQDNTLTGHTNHGIYVEGCNNNTVAGNTVADTDGFGNGFADDFIGGAINIAESTNTAVTGNTINNCERALVNRMSNRSSDWYNSNNSTFVNYAWPTGNRYWITATGPTPIVGVGDRASMWTGNNTFQDNVLVNCGRVVINEGTNNGGMTTQGSTPISTIRFIGNDYTGSAGIEFYDRSNTPLTLGQWQSIPLDRDN